MGEGSYGSNLRQRATLDLTVESLPGLVPKSAQEGSWNRESMYRGKQGGIN